MENRIWIRDVLVAEVRSATSNRVALLHPHASQPVVLEGTAAQIWLLIDGQATQHEIIREMLETFNDAGANAASQMAEFIVSLKDHQLIRALK